MAGGIPVSPMNDSAFCVPYVFPIELDGIAATKGIQPRGEIDVMGDQHGLAGIETNDEALMTAAIIVVSKHLGNTPLTLHLNIAGAIVKGARQC